MAVNAIRISTKTRFSFYDVPDHEQALLRLAGMTNEVVLFFAGRQI